jgi:hypothetical protein
MIEPEKRRRGGLSHGFYQEIGEKSPKIQVFRYFD